MTDQTFAEALITGAQVYATLRPRDGDGRMAVAFGLLRRLDETGVDLAPLAEHLERLLKDMAWVAQRMTEEQKATVHSTIASIQEVRRAAAVLEVESANHRVENLRDHLAAGPFQDVAFERKGSYGIVLPGTKTGPITRETNPAYPYEVWNMTGYYTKAPDGTRQRIPTCYVLVNIYAPNRARLVAYNNAGNNPSATMRGLREFCWRLNNNSQKLAPEYEVIWAEYAAQRPSGS